MFNEGISSAGCILDLAVEHNIIEKKGSWFNYQERKLGQGREAVREELKKNKKLFDELEKCILEATSAKSLVTEDNKEPLLATVAS